MVLLRLWPVQTYLCFAVKNVKNVWSRYGFWSGFWLWCGVVETSPKRCLTNVFQYGVPLLGLPTMDLWSGTSDIRDRCFLLLLGNTLVPKDTCVSFTVSNLPLMFQLHHNLFFGATIQVGDICFGVSMVYLTPTCEAFLFMPVISVCKKFPKALAQYVILNLVTAVICDNSMRIVSVRDPGKIKPRGAWNLWEFSLPGKSARSLRMCWWKSMDKNYDLFFYALTVTIVGWTRFNSLESQSPCSFQS